MSLASSKGSNLLVLLTGRVPGHFCGCVGIKPTVGRFSTTGVVPACRALDCISIFSRCVEDGAVVARLMQVHCTATIQQLHRYCLHLSWHDSCMRSHLTDLPQQTTSCDLPKMPEHCGRISSEVVLPSSGVCEGKYLLLLYTAQRFFRNAYMHKNDLKNLGVGGPCRKLAGSSRIPTGDSALRLSPDLVQA